MAVSNTHSRVVPTTGETGWHKITDLPDFKKWQYGDSPYRVVADLHEERGHWRALFTSWYGGESYLIAGNLGKEGKWSAIAAAKSFMQENSNGCPPPSEYNI